MILTLKLLPPLLGVLLLGTLGLAGQDSAAGADEKTLDQWKARIEKVRGLKFKEPVRVERIARGAGEDPGKQGYYDPAAKRLVLFADVKGNYQQGVLIHQGLLLPQGLMLYNLLLHNNWLFCTPG